MIGSTFNVNGKPFSIVGVSPPGFFGDTLRSNLPDFFLPLTTEPLVQSDADLQKYDTHWLELIGRLQPGATPATVEAQMRAELTQWLRSHWEEMSVSERALLPEQTLFLSPGGSGITSMRQQYEQWLVILMAVTGFVLLIVCANIANLMLVRGMERRRQISLRMAIGAGVSRIVRQPLIESLLISLAGGAAVSGGDGVGLLDTCRGFGRGIRLRAKTSHTTGAVATPAKMRPRVPVRSVPTFSA